MSKRQVFIGAVIVHPTGTNPYDRTAHNPYRMGEQRVSVLRIFRDTGTLPEGVSLHRDAGADSGPITSPDEIDWAHLRD